MTINLIVAVDSKNGIGKDNTIPWNIPEDMKHFYNITTQDNTKKNVVIMGRKTWESIPETHKPLKNRINVILTKNHIWLERNKEVLGEHYNDSNIRINNSFTDVINYYDDKSYNVFIIGGAQIYNEALKLSTPDKIYLTRIYKDFECDSFINEIPGTYLFNTFSDKKEINNVKYQFFEYCLKNENQETQYLNILENILNNGTKRTDRTDTGTLGTFGHRMEFDLKNEFPLLTTKTVPFKMVAKELLWFIAGDTDNKNLQKQNVHIWDGNSSREFLDKRGLTHYQEGDIGPAYGFQWRHFNATYKGCSENYNNQGTDQLKYCIDLIKNDPTSRRILFTGWNPEVLDQMALTPCHSIVVQFYIDNNEFLDCQMYQRSADCFLGVPFNIASYSLLTHMIAHITNLKPGKFIHICGDTHIYLNHIEQCKEQLKRTPLPFPKLVINSDNNIKNIDDFQLEDFKIINYRKHSKINAFMSV